MTPKNQQQNHRVPKEMLFVYDEVTKYTDDFCDAHMNAEYKELSRKMAAALCRKRPSPLIGRVHSYSPAIIYTLASNNFMFDKSQSPHMKASELCQLLKMAKSTASQRSQEITRLLKIYRFDPNWTLPSSLEHNPIAWMVMVNGMYVDARDLPYLDQIYAFRRKIIPFAVIRNDDPSRQLYDALECLKAQEIEAAKELLADSIRRFPKYGEAKKVLDILAEHDQMAVKHKNKAKS